VSDPASGSPAAPADLQARIAEKRRALAALEAEIAALEAAAGGPVSPLAPPRFPDLPPLAGLQMATAATGIKYRGRDDLMLARLDPGAAIAGVFTRSATRSAPVLWCEAACARLAGSLAPGPVGILVNAGNANAFTGDHGRASVERVMAALAPRIGADPATCFMASTGVIGEPLPDARIANELDGLAAALAPGGQEAAARAIMTTDTFPKGAAAVAEVDGVPITVTGICKGSGMIAPDMATMLGFLFTDAPLAPSLCQQLLGELTDRTFNAVTVDGDTSTSDTLLFAATGKAPITPIERADDPRLGPIREAMSTVMTDLTIQLARDGEGATKLVTIHVTGAETDAAAKRVALSIANSPLVKTAFAGEDPNWGRIVMAVGKAGERADRDRLAIRFGDIQVADAGWVAPGYREEDGAAYMRRAELEVTVDLGIGAGRARVWTCDLTKAYVAINADYRS